MGVVSTEALLFILVAIFASNCHARPTRGRWNIKEFVRPPTFEREFLESILLRTRPKRQAITPTISINIKLFSTTRWFLAIKDNGDVEGIADVNSPNVILRLESVGKSLVRLYGNKAKRYLAMDSRGRLYSKKYKDNTDTIFYQYMGVTGFNSFSSASHLNPSTKKPMYVALRDNGLPKKGIRTKGSHKSTKFTVMHLRK